jgi:2,4-dienoyl-CoA reductase (NADPH2)
VDAAARVVDVWELLTSPPDEVPSSVAVVDDGSGFWHGVSAAELLAQRGASVELVTPARAVGLEIPEESVAGVHRRLRSNGVRFRTLAKVTAVGGTTLRLADVITGEPSETTAEMVVVRTELRAADELVTELDGKVPALVAIGDCAAPRRLNHAVLEANVALRRFHEGRLGSTAVVLS